MNRKIQNLAKGLSIVLLAATVTPLMADKSNSENKSIVSPIHSYNGHSYSEWAVKWFQYANSLPLAKHPLNDTADCSIGQKGSVWFLGGTLGRPYPAEGRDCTIPPGTAILLNVGAQSWDNEGCDGKKIKKTSLSENELRNNTQAVLNQTFGSRKVIIDGVEVKGLPKACDSAKPESCQSNYRIQTPVFDYKVPARDNTLILFNGACYDNPNNGHSYKVKDAVGEGYFVMIKPLTLGKHTLRHFKVDATGKPTRLYNITVSKKPHKTEYQTSKNSFN